MGAKTNYAENQFIDTFIRGQAKPALPTWFIGLAISSAGKHAVSSAYALNDTLFIQDVNSKWRLYQCTTAGTTAASQAVYPGIVDEVVTDGSAVFTEQNAALESGGAIVEPSGGAYARVAVSASLALWSGTQGAGTTVASSGTAAQTSNNSPIAFADPTEDWGTIGLFVFFDALTGGNPWIYSGLDNPILISNGITNIQFAQGTLQYTEDG